MLLVCFVVIRRKSYEEQINAIFFCLYLVWATLVYTAADCQQSKALHRIVINPTAESFALEQRGKQLLSAHEISAVEPYGVVRKQCTVSPESTIHDWLKVYQASQYPLKALRATQDYDNVRLERTPGFSQENGKNTFVVILQNSVLARCFAHSEADYSTILVAPGTEGYWFQKADNNSKIFLLGHYSLLQPEEFNGEDFVLSKFHRTKKFLDWYEFKRTGVLDLAKKTLIFIKDTLINGEVIPQARTFQW
jgi:hypothetical protein